MAPARAGQGGFTYLGLLFAIAILGITLATVGVVWSTQIRRDREAELLFIGDQFRVAIGRYVQSGGIYPRALADLVEDKRVPVPRRFLRRVYADPMTGNADWQLIHTADGGIMGVASSSQQQPIKVAGFPTADAAFADAACYCDWTFNYVARINSRKRLPQPPKSH